MSTTKVIGETGDPHSVKGAGQSGLGKHGFPALDGMGKPGGIFGLQAISSMFIANAAGEKQQTSPK